MLFFIAGVTIKMMPSDDRATAEPSKNCYQKEQFDKFQSWESSPHPLRPGMETRWW
jgi:hypothetical protein